MNMGTDAESFEKSVRIPFQKDEFNPVRAEYSQMLKKQLSQRKRIMLQLPLKSMLKVL